MERGYERRGVAALLAGAAGLAARLLGGSASARLDAGDGSSPARLSGARVNPGRRGVLAMAVVTVLTVLVAGGWVLAARPHPMLASTASSVDAGEPPPPAPGGSLTSPHAGPTGPPVPRTSSAGPGSAPLVVDVAGKVRRPGVYRLPPGARVDDAVRAAGGFLGRVDPATVNLARKLVDGEQVLIGVSGSGAASGPGDPGAASARPGDGGSAPLDLNSATLAQLDGLPGVGPALAQHILDWRTQHGRFDTVEQLNGVSGIGDSKYADLRPLVTVG